MPSPRRNAAVGFDGMTASAVALVTDASRDGRPVVGYGFSSIGRYGHGGLLRERFSSSGSNNCPFPKVRWRLISCGLVCSPSTEPRLLMTRTSPKYILRPGSIS